MALTIFESRQLVKELINQAKQLWDKTDHADKMEGLVDDPVFRMLFSALAHHLSLIDKEITRLRSDVLNEYADYMTPNEGIRAIPATMAISTNLADGFDELTVNQNTKFGVRDQNIDLVPLLNTKVVNIQKTEIERLDGRRWKVTLHFSGPIRNLAGFSFAIMDSTFRGFKPTIKGRNVRIIRPWQFSEQPFNSYFSIDTALYNNHQVYDPSNVSMDLFAGQNLTNFIISDFPLTDVSEYGEDKVEILFEFTGISPQFVFDKSKLKLNTIILTNVSYHSVELTEQRPIARIADTNGKLPAGESRKADFFMHLIPSQKGLLPKDNIMVRSYTSERFNPLSLLKLINVIIAKIDTDRAAFSAIPAQQSDNVLLSLRDIMRELKQALVHEGKESTRAGIYICYKDSVISKPITVEYLTTAGSTINSVIMSGPNLTVPLGFNADQTVQICEPQPGVDANHDSASLFALSQYMFATGDRLVTPADIKMFCLAVLQMRYNLDRKLIRSVSVEHRPVPSDHMLGYEIIVDIVIEDNPFVKKALSNDISRIEMTIEKMIQVRSTNIYPIRTHIKIDSE